MNLAATIERGIAIAPPCTDEPLFGKDCIGRYEDSVRGRNIAMTRWQAAKLCAACRIRWHFHCAALELSAIGGLG